MSSFLKIILGFAFSFPVFADVSVKKEKTNDPIEANESLEDKIIKFDSKFVLETVDSEGWKYVLTANGNLYMISGDGNTVITLKENLIPSREVPNYFYMRPVLEGGKLVFTGMDGWDAFRRTYSNSFIGKANEEEL